MSEAPQVDQPCHTAPDQPVVLRVVAEEAATGSEMFHGTDRVLDGDPHLRDQPVRLALLTRQIALLGLLDRSHRLSMRIQRVQAVVASIAPQSHTGRRPAFESRTAQQLHIVHPTGHRGAEVSNQAVGRHGHLCFDRVRASLDAVKLLLVHGTTHGLLARCLALLDLRLASGLFAGVHDQVLELGKRLDELVERPDLTPLLDALFWRLVRPGAQRAGTQGSGQGLFENGQQGVNASADVAVIEIEEQPEDVHREVLAQVQKRHQQSFGQLELECPSTADGPNTVDAQQTASMSAFPVRLEFDQQLLEGIGRQADQSLEGFGASHQLLGAQHPKNLAPRPLTTQ